MSADGSAPVPVGASHKRPLSALLREIADDSTRERVSVGDLLAALRDRALGALLFVFAFPNALPLPPGSSSVLGAPLLFLAAQLALGRPPWLPRLIAERSMTRADFAVLVDRIAPWLARAERLLRPRLSVLAAPPFEYVVGLVCLALAVILVLPIPLGNMLPALAITVLALGILERDGVWVLAGLAIAVLAVSVVWGVLYAMVEGALFVLRRLIV